MAAPCDRVGRLSEIQDVAEKANGPGNAPARCITFVIWRSAPLIVGEDVLLVGATRHEDQADHHRHHSDHDRVPEASIDIAGVGGNRECGCRHQTTQPAVANMVGCLSPLKLSHFGGLNRGDLGWYESGIRVRIA